MHVGSVTSAEVRWATASWRVGSNGSPFSPNAVSPNLPSAAVELLGHRAERPDQVAVLAGPVEIVEHRQQRAEHHAGGLLGRQRPVAVDPLAVVGVFGGDPLQVAGALVQLGPQRTRARRRARRRSPSSSPALRRLRPRWPPASAAGAGVSTGCCSAGACGPAPRCLLRRLRSASSRRRLAGRVDPSLVPDDDPLRFLAVGPVALGATRRRPGGGRVGGSWLFRHADILTDVAALRSLLVVLSTISASTTSSGTAAGAGRCRTGARGRAGAVGSPGRRRAGGRPARPAAAVEQRAGLLRDLRQLLVRRLDLLDVGAAERAAQVAQRLVDLRRALGRELVAALGEELLGLPLELPRPGCGSPPPRGGACPRRRGPARRASSARCRPSAAPSRR